MRSSHSASGSTVGGADVDERVEGVFDDLLGQRAGRVVRTGRAAMRRVGDIDAAGLEHRRCSGGIWPNQLREPASTRRV